ncbi:hypothetical protein H0V99_04010 [Candidatus Saccharibacteria bacterium]|nr:hypothetical protein [Candidatus Saccharibacteria bacterium]
MATAESYVPYKAIAEASINDDETITPFLEYVVPGITADQMQKIIEFMKNQAHEFIGIGLELSTKDPLGDVVAYNTGYDDALSDMNDLSEGG